MKGLNAQLLYYPATVICPNFPESERVKTHQRTHELDDVIHSQVTLRRQLINHPVCKHRGKSSTMRSKHQINRHLCIQHQLTQQRSKSETFGMFTNILMYTHTQTLTHIHTHTLIHTHTNTHSYTCKHSHAYILTCTHPHTDTHSHTYTHSYTYTHTCTHTTCTHIHTLVRTHMRAHTHHTHTTSLTHTHTHVHTHTHTYLHAHTYTFTCTPHHSHTRAHTQSHTLTRHALLGDLPVIDLPLHGAITDQAVDEARSGLPIPVDPTHCLGIMTRVPRHIQHHHTVSPHQVHT